MPRLYPDAPDLTVSPDGSWAADLHAGSLRLYELRELRDPREPSAPVLPLTETERPSRPGRILFLTSDRLLHLWHEPGSGDEPDVMHAELLAVPTLEAVGRPLRVTGAQRILGLGPGGAVLAPKGPGADIVSLRAGELVLQRTFTRGEVLSAVPAPDRRFLFEQRSGYELWDPALRKALARLVLNTRQVAVQLGYVSGGKMLWAITGNIPVHVEIFRASDGRRMLELDQPGRALAAEATVGRLIVAIEEREGICFMDLDLVVRGTRRVSLPAGRGKLLSFGLRGLAHAPEVLALFDGGEEAGEPQPPVLVRLPLVRSQPRPPAPLGGAAGAGTGDDRAAARPGARPAARPERPAPASPSSLSQTRTSALRQGRPESRLIRRGPSYAEPGDTAEYPAPLDDTPDAPRGYPPFGRESAIDLEGADFDAGEAPELDGDPGDAAPIPVAVLGAAPEGEPAIAAPSARRGPPLTRVFDPAQSPAAWQWELSRWAQNVLAGGAADFGVAPQMPEGGPVQQLAGRVRLGAPGQRVLGLLHAAQFLLASRPRGMRPIEIARCLGALYDEPLVLAELLPHAPLRTAGLVVQGEGGRLKLRGEVGRMLAGAPCPDLLSPSYGGAGRDELPAGLHLYPAPLPRSPAQLCSQPILRVDGLATPRPVQAVETALRRAQLYDAAVVLDGFPGLSFPAFSSDGSLGQLRALLQAPRVPVILCAMPDAVSTLGLSARALGSALLQAHTEGPAPLVPSAPLPVGTSWRPPVLPATAAHVDTSGRQGRLEPMATGDRRAAILIGPSAVPEAYASAAYLAARDGAVLALDAELTTVRALVLAMLLRQLPVLITATPPGGPGGPWPPLLSPFSTGGGR